VVAENVRVWLRHPTIVTRHPHARGHCVLVHVQASATRNQRLHLLAPPSTTGRCHPEEPLPEESESRARGNSAGCPRLPRQTYQRARGTKEHRRRPDDEHIFIRRGWPATAMGGLSGITSRAPCYPAFPQAVRLRTCRRDGVNRGPRILSARRASAGPMRHSSSLSCFRNVCLIRSAGDQTSNCPQGRPAHALILPRGRSTCK
jgi:hypothetical protein